jgi:hypothetical protein
MLWHSGQTGTSVLTRTSFSNSCEHFWHLYSKIGMAAGYQNAAGVGSLAVAGKAPTQWRSNPRKNPMRLAPFALFTGLLPLLCVHVTYLLAASYGHVEWCVPYWDSCTSISATGRELPEKLLFKLLMLPSALCALAFWWIAAQWLRITCGVRARAMFASGGIAALFLMLYVVALGESNDYRWARQTGIILFFSLTYVAQLRFLFHCAHRANSPLQLSIFRWQRSAAALLLGVGMLSVVLDATYANYTGIEDAFEWIMMLFIALQFCSHYPLWKDSNLRVAIDGDGDSARPPR